MCSSAAQHTRVLVHRLGGRVCARMAEKCFPLCLPVWMPSAPRSSLKLCIQWTQKPLHNTLISLKPSPATRASSLPLNFNKSTRTAARRKHEEKGRATRREGWGSLVSWLGVPSSSSRAWLLGPNYIKKYTSKNILKFSRNI